MRFGLLLLLPLCLLWPALRADTTQPLGDWDSVTVAPLKTSVFIATVTLATGVFARRDGDYTATYEARVRPWFFWSETGRITITLDDDRLRRLSQGERIEFKGEAVNHRGRPRRVTGHAERTDAANGRLKIRLSADGIDLAFTGTYRFNNVVK